MSKKTFHHILFLILTFVFILLLTPSNTIQAIGNITSTLNPPRIFVGTPDSFTVTVKTTNTFNDVYYKYKLYNLTIPSEFYPPQGASRISRQNAQTIVVKVYYNNVNHIGIWRLKLWIDGQNENNPLVTTDILVEQPGGGVPSIQSVQSPLGTSTTRQNVDFLLNNVNENNDYVLWWNDDPNPQIPLASSQCFSKDYIRKYADSHRLDWRNQMLVQIGPGTKQDRFAKEATYQVCMDNHACSNQVEMSIGNLVCRYKASIEFKVGTQPTPTPIPSVNISTTPNDRIRVGDRLTVSWSTLINPREQDLVGFYTEGDPNTAFTNSNYYFYLQNCDTSIPTKLPLTSGACSFDIPQDISVEEEGKNYEFRLYSHSFGNEGAFPLLATSKILILPSSSPPTFTGPTPTKGPPPTPTLAISDSSRTTRGCAPGEPNCTSAAGLSCDPDNPKINHKTGRPIDGQSGGVWTAVGCIPTQPTKLIESLFKLATAVGGGVALLLFVYGAFQMITSGGNPDGVKKGSEQMTSAVIGLLFIIFSVMLLKIIGVDILMIPGFTP